MACTNAFGDKIKEIWERYTAAPTLWRDEFDVFWKLGLLALLDLLSMLHRLGVPKNMSWFNNKDWPGITGLSALLVAVLLGFQYLFG